MSQKDAPIKAEVVNEQTNLPATQQQPSRQQMMQGELTEMCGDGMPAIHNFKGTGVELWKFTSKATGPDVLTADEFPAEGIDLQWIYCHAVEVTQPTGGEVVKAYRTVLFDTKGNAYGFVSDGVFLSAVGIFKAFNFDEIKPPLKVKLGSKRTRSSYKVLMLVPA